ncbi:50S ribosomal protein L28 [Patescibacteria group bacterium]|nr:50S ribosomal protein L28 [Patescibacteria group bacterium]MBU1906854.1 50S ribosomal protein L28 [Patescibacteria group bacterium]
MAKFCESCGRGPLTANNRSKSMVATKRRMKVNLQNKTIGGKKMQVCTKCLKGFTAGKIVPTTTAPKRVGIRSKKGK